MSQTRPTGEQLRFRSSKTGEHIVDDYFETAELGSRTLADLLGDLFDPNTGVIYNDLVELRVNATTRMLQSRTGDFVGPEDGWQDVPNGRIFRVRGAYVQGSAYDALDVVTHDQNLYIAKVAGTSGTATPDLNIFHLAVDGTAAKALSDLLPNSVPGRSGSGPVQSLFISEGTVLGRLVGGNLNVLNATQLKTLLSISNVENKSSATIRSEITSGNVTAALGFTPYDASNPAGYLTSAPVSSVAGKTGAVTLNVGDIAGAAPSASPALTGTPTGPTAATGTNTSQLATTAFVQQEITNSVAGVASFNGRSGAVSLLSGDVSTALGYTPYNASNPAGYLTGITGPQVTTALGYTPASTSSPTFSGTATFSSISAGSNIIASGVVRSQSAGNGYIDIQAGAPAAPGYINFFSADGTRRGFIGFASGTNLLITSENGWNYSFSQRPIFAGQTPWDSGNFNPATKIDVSSATAAVVANSVVQRNAASRFSAVGIDFINDLNSLTAGAPWYGVGKTDGSLTSWAGGANNNAVVQFAGYYGLRIRTLNTVLDFDATAGVVNLSTGTLQVGGSAVWTAASLTNLNQLTNGPGYLTTITGPQVTAALGFTPYNASNPSGYITTAGRAFPRRSDGSNFDLLWSDPGGSPAYIIGSNDGGVNLRPFFPANITVGFATSATTAASASSVPWTGVSGRPTGLSAFSNDTNFLSGTVGIGNGGTGGTTAAAARTNLGLGSAATQASSAFKTAGAVEPIATGGTGGTDAATARSNLGIGSMATRNVTISTAAPSGGSDGDIWLRIP